jgi:Cu(I)/Ag(I) efflux system membrane fusion protein
MTLANPQTKLVPGMFVRMRLQKTQGSLSRTALLVPSESLVRTGKRTLVMVVEDEGFRPVEVQVGREQNGQAEVLSGLSQGQKIVLSGQFLIDSEASLKGVEARLSSGQAKVSTGAAGPVHHTTALVEAVDGDIVTLTHPDIPSLKWPGMTMDFKLASATPNQPFVGSEIEIEFRMQDDDMPQIIRWQLHTSAVKGGAE